MIRKKKHFLKEYNKISYPFTFTFIVLGLRFDMKTILLLHLISLFFFSKKIKAKTIGIGSKRVLIVSKFELIYNNKAKKK